MTEKTDLELRREVSDEIGEAHAVAAVYVTFPREDNDVERIDATSTQFSCNLESMTESVAADKVMSDALDELAGESRSRGGGLTDVAAMPVPDDLAKQLEAAMNGGDEEDDGDEDDETGYGFQ